MRHLGSALLAVGLLAAALAGGVLYARWVESRYIHALASGMFASPLRGDTLPPELAQEVEGSVLQSEAVRQPDLLPIYGSSELLWRSDQGEFNGSQVFRGYPTGFALFPVGKQGTPALVILQDLAAIGPELRGRKVAISLSPSWLLHNPSEDQAYYAGNFSRLHAGELAFSTDLSYELKREAAERMLPFPATVEQDPLLKFALERLVDPSPLGPGLYYAALPLGKLQNVVLRLQDHWATLALIRGRPALTADVPREAAALDWSQLRSEAGRMARLLAARWARRAAPERNSELTPRGEEFLRTVRESPSWIDLALLMRGLKELGARPLILSQPLAGAFFDQLGVSQGAREEFYARFREITRPYGVPVVDFAEHDEDRFFVSDARSHLSAQGWLYYDEALDTFYHDEVLDTFYHEASG